MTKSPHRRQKILIAGLGNELLGDDGVGVHAVRLLACQKAFKGLPGVKAVEVGVHVLDAFHLFEWADHIVALDAMRAAGKPGTLYAATDSDIQGWDPTGGLHEFSLIGSLRMLRHKPPVTIFGIEPETIDYGMELSPALQAALPGYAARVREFVTGLRNGQELLCPDGRTLHTRVL